MKKDRCLDNNQYVCYKICRVKLLFKKRYVYPKGYKVRSITEQTNILRQLFPGIGYADERIVKGPLPEGAEGWFAIPRWENIASSYNEAVEKMLELIRQQRKGRFCNYRAGRLGPYYLKQTEKATMMFHKIEQEQKGYDILVVPAQFGLRHRNLFVEQARAVMNAGEFGFGAFAVGIMLLIHPEREVQWEQLHVQCAGDDFSNLIHGEWSRAPLFDFNDDEIKFGAGWFLSTYAHYGSASGFVSPSSV
ncbi:MAG: hypothetical protein HYW70_02380 [Candidatus Nealsonbacteria bacterium]|nr:hypothetical protein [Candidatus Nealsonbacteria bacterium]